MAAPQGLKTWGVLASVGIVGAAMALFGSSPSVRTADSPAGSAALSCEAPRLRDCSFYGACLEANVPCGPTGYALGFGEKYCERFKSATLSTRGAAWADSVMLCLEQALVPYDRPDKKSASCDEITRAAFDSHPACYTAEPASICFLPPPDVLAVFDTIGADEIFAARTREQIQAVIATCTVQVAARSVDVVIPPYDAGRGVGHGAGHGAGDGAQLAFWKDLAAKYRVPGAKPPRAPPRGPNEGP